MNAQTRGRWWLYALLTILLIVVIAPFIWMILGSFKTQGELLQSPPTWWPQTASLDNYTQLFSRLNFKQYFFNSTVVAVCVTAGNLLFCSMLGYALAMLDFKGKKILFAVVMGTLMIPGVVTFVPLFVLVANIGLIDSLPGLILPFLVTPFGVFLMRQFFLGLPRDLLDAGRVDGAGEHQVDLVVVELPSLQRQGVFEVAVVPQVRGDGRRPGRLRVLPGALVVGPGRAHPRLRGA